MMKIKMKEENEKGVEDVVKRSEEIEDQKRTESTKEKKKTDLQDHEKQPSEEDCHRWHRWGWEGRHVGEEERRCEQYQRSQPDGEQCHH